MSHQNYIAHNLYPYNGKCKVVHILILIVEQTENQNSIMARTLLFGMRKTCIYKKMKIYNEKL